MVVGLVEVDEVVAAVAVVFDQAELRLVPLVAVLAGGKADALEPAGFVALAEVPHQQYIVDAHDGPVVDYAPAVGRALLPQADDDARATAGRMVAVKMQLDAALQRQAVIIEREEYDFVELLQRPAVVNDHR